MKRKNYNDITLGQFIDIESLLKATGKIVDVNYYLWEFGEGEDEDDLSYNEVLGAINDYNKWSKSIYVDYAPLFTRTDDDGDDANTRMLKNAGVNVDDYELDDEQKLTEDDKEFNRKFAWYKVAYQLAGEDFLRINEVFKRPLISVLNHLTFKLSKR